MFIPITWLDSQGPRSLVQGLSWTFFGWSWSLWCGDGAGTGWVLLAWLISSHSSSVSGVLPTLPVLLTLQSQHPSYPISSHSSHILLLWQQGYGRMVALVPQGTFLLFSLHSVCHRLMCGCFSYLLEIHVLACPSLSLLAFLLGLWYLFYFLVLVEIFTCFDCMCMNVCCLCVCVCAMSMECPQRPGGCESPGAALTHSCVSAGVKGLYHHTQPFLF